MKIQVKVIPNAKKAGIEVKEGVYVVRTTAIPEKGKANQKVIRLLAKYLNIPPSHLTIIRGGTGRNKTLEVND